MLSPRIFLLCALLAPTAVAEPPEDAELVEALDAYLDKLAAEDRFSGAVLVAVGEETLFRKAYGLASKRFGVANRPDTKFNIGSMNKMFTGAAICLLAERGELSFDDTVGKHLPDYPNSEVRDKVTLHHLLTHTSGMGSYFNEAWERDWKKLRKVSDLLPLFQDDPLAFEPGARFQYSNVGPTVLGLVIEAISGQSYYDFVRDNVFEPCGMEATDSYELDSPVPNLAQGYTHWNSETESDDGPWRNNVLLHSVKGGPAGGGYSTLDDLLRFSIALQFNELLSEEMTDTLLTPRVSMGRPGMRYGYLFGTRGGGEGRSVGHNGGAPGISADFSFYPETGYTIAILSNYDMGAMQVSRFVKSLINR